MAKDVLPDLYSSDTDIALHKNYSTQDLIIKDSYLTSLPWCFLYFQEKANSFSAAIIFILPVKGTSFRLCLIQHTQFENSK